MLRALDCDIGAAECHGILCGMLCGPRAFDHGLWLAHLSGRDDLTPLTQGEPAAALAALAEHTLQALAAGDYGFTLLLPDDEQPLPRRAGAFAAWCRGYLSGLGLAGIADTATLGEDARGFLRDVERFGALEVGPDAGEDDERAFAEVTEFVRMGVLIVYAERETAADGFEAPPGLH